MDRIPRGESAVIPIRKISLNNGCFRREIWTGEHSQITVMCIPAGGEIGLERHETLDQLLYVTYGVGSFYAGKEKSEVTFVGDAGTSDLIVIPAGEYHNVLNRRNVPLKLISIYAPPNHAVGTIHRTKFEADLSEE